MAHFSNLPVLTVFYSFLLIFSFLMINFYFQSSLDINTFLLMKGKEVFFSLIMGLKLNDAVSNHMKLLHTFHKSVNNTIFFILGVVLIGLIVSWKFLGNNFRIVENHGLEFFWTIMPTLILFFIAVPSLIVLYQEFPDYYTSFFYTIIGHQWYWSYVNSFISKEEVDSFLTSSNSFRNLEVDNSLIFPVKTGIRMYVTSADVIHSFSIPSLAVKVDAVPGRLKECFTYPLNMGKFYGQCSEICGANHAFMPISVEVVPLLS